MVQMLINRFNCYSDDGSAEAEGREWEDDDDFSSNFLAEIIEKSLWVFYEFLLSDKDDVKNILKCNRKHQIELQNSENPQHLLLNIQAHFQKVGLAYQSFLHQWQWLSVSSYLTNSVSWGCRQRES